MKQLIKISLFAAIALMLIAPSAIAATEPQIIVLTQTPCQFIESEKVLL